MNKKAFMELMQFPPQWETLQMYPNALFEAQVSSYEPGNELGSEHDRNGAFHWWLRKNPDSDCLLKLVALSKIDPDQIMAADVRDYIRQSGQCNSAVIRALDDC
ncbi:hypothetical protein HPT27_12655 [Permianibacter sp. IMCC34836]|uniref:hypothetical protein n=1 Tax=Permianibacter fluminis TaxID=2738515 RepID=UPI001552FA00|nr:hypothetical protein [Permianibacter fluminis]NQD37879.1 hypothetical protein [Permianibacter fluminis]